MVVGCPTAGSCCRSTALAGSPADRRDGCWRSAGSGRIGNTSASRPRSLSPRLTRRAVHRSVEPIVASDVPRRKDARAEQPLVIGHVIARERVERLGGGRGEPPLDHAASVRTPSIAGARRRRGSSTASAFSIAMRSGKVRSVPPCGNNLHRRQEAETLSARRAAPRGSADRCRRPRSARPARDRSTTENVTLRRADRRVTRTTIT